MAKQDFKLDSNSDILIQNGDFVIGNNELPQAKITLNAAKGEIRQYPLVGANFTSLLGSNIDSGVLYNLAKNELSNVGIDLSNIEITRNNGNYDVKIELNNQ
jgi:hypothetical protein